MKLKQRKPDYKWVILAACFIMEFFCLGFCSGNKSLYLSAITEALDIKRSLFAINDSCRYIATAVLNLFFGAMITKWGVRKMVSAGVLCLAASFLVNAYAVEVYHFYIGGVLLGMGLAFSGTTMGSYIVKQWCSTNIGRYTGIVLAANGIGGAVAAQIISPMINDPSNAFGYRNSYKFVAVCVLVVGVIVVALLRDKPKEGHAIPVSGTKKARGQIWYGIEYDVLKKRGYFYLAAICVFLTGTILQSINGIYAAHMKDIGMDAGYVATVASVFSLTLTGTKILVGLLYDRLGLRVSLLICQAATILAFVFLIFLSASASGAVMAMAFGILFAVGIPLETIVVPLVTNELFGSVSYNKLLGIMMALNTAGFALGSPIVNLFFDASGSYIPVLWIFCGLMLMIMITFQFVITAAQKDKEAILSALEET